MLLDDCGSSLGELLVAPGVGGIVSDDVSDEDCWACEEVDDSQTGRFVTKKNANADTAKKPKVSE